MQQPPDGGGSMTYHTQMEAARQGVLTPQMEQVLHNEPISRDQLLDSVATGHIAIPANRLHTGLKGAGIGQGLRTKINVNLGYPRTAAIWIWR